MSFLTAVCCNDMNYLVSHVALNGNLIKISPGEFCLIRNKKKSPLSRNGSCISTHTMHTFVEVPTVVSMFKGVLSFLEYLLVMGKGNLQSV